MYPNDTPRVLEYLGYPPHLWAWTDFGKFQWLGDGDGPSLEEIHAAANSSEYAAWGGPVPKSVTRYQARAWIFVRGLSLEFWSTADDMDTFMLAAIDNFPGLSGVERQLARIKWKEALLVERGDALMLALCPILGLTSTEDVDQAFREAAAID